MCPVDLKRSLGEATHPYVVGNATLKGYRLGFYRRSQLRNCGVLDIVVEATASVEGVLYCLPMRLSDRLDEREEVPGNGYRQEIVEVNNGKRLYKNVRTYVVIDKLAEELAPNDWYFNVVLRGQSPVGYRNNTVGSCLTICTGCSNVRYFKLLSLLSISELY